MSAISALFALLALHMPLSPLSAQAPVRRLATAEAVHAEGFTRVSGLRELRDGRVIVSDAADNTLQLIDLKTGRSTPVGRMGAGPLEWGGASRLYAMPGDSTLMEDLRNDRFFVIAPDGKPAGTIRVDHPEVRRSSFLGVDARGAFIIATERSGANGPLAGTNGTRDVMRFDRRTSRLDTIAQYAVPRGEFSGASTLPGGMLQFFTNLPLAARDVVANSAALAHERVGIVRFDPYRVEWFPQRGAPVVGPAVPVRAIRIDDAEKQAFMESQIRPGRITVRAADEARLAGGAGSGAVGGGSASGGTGARGGGGAGAISAAAMKAMRNPELTWPATKPPFLDGAASIAADGRLWVLRSRAHDDPVPSYDVFDGAGKLVERVELPPKARVVGFGRGVVYITRPDADDLLMLERHRLR